jgi:hypothetical protein
MGKEYKQCVMSPYHKYLLSKSPLNLFKKNFIGHPSTTLIENNISDWYDIRYKWVVDIEFYIRYLSATNSFHFIPEPLVNIGISNLQVTVSAFRNPAIEVPENILLLKEITAKALNNIFVYDYYWRFIRNLSVRNISVVREYYSESEIPIILERMIQQQNYIPIRLTHFGVISKVTMLITYLANRLNKRIK